jgi:hypothetical protein
MMKSYHRDLAAVDGDPAVLPPGRRLHAHSSGFLSRARHRQCLSTFLLLIKSAWGSFPPLLSWVGLPLRRQTPAAARPHRASIRRWFSPLFIAVVRLEHSLCSAR